MARRISWINNSSGHDGTRIYRADAPMDPQNLPAPIATIPAQPVGTVEYIDSEELANGTYYYRVQDYSGAEVSAASEGVSLSIGFPASVGDEIEGGYFAGVMLDPADDSEYALIVAPLDTGSLGDSAASEQEAHNFCNNLVIGGFSDWSLPSVDELRVSYRAYKPTAAANDTGYGATDRTEPPLANYTANEPGKTQHIKFQQGGVEAFFAKAYWSQTQSQATGNGVFLYFSDGRDSSVSFDTNCRVRAVRRVPV